MKLDCAKVEEAIWNSMRDGIHLSGAELQHTQHCGSCRQAITEVETCGDILDCLKPCPRAPDCRQQIRPGSRRTNLSLHDSFLAWIPAAVFFALVILAVFQHGRPADHRKQLTSSAQTGTVTTQSHPSSDSGASRSSKPKMQAAIESGRSLHLRVHHSRRYMSGSSSELRRQAPVQQAARAGAEPANAQDKGLAIGAVAHQLPASDTDVRSITCTWSPNNVESVTVHEHSEGSRETGLIIMRHTGRTDNSIDITVESVPEIQPSKEGC